MTQFDFILNNTKYKAIYDACVLAENADTPSDMASNCRNALLTIVEFIYEKHSVEIQKNATMLELIDNKLITGFVDNSVILETLHFIRKLGMNAQHDKNIKKKY